MRRVAVAVQQDDDRDLDAERGQLAGGGDRLGFGQRVELAAVGGDAAADLAHQGARDQRQRAARIEAHRMRDRQALQLEQVAEPARHQHADARALALDQRVGSDRAAVGVHHPAPRRLVGHQRRFDLVDAFENAGAGPRRRARHLEAVQFAAGGIEHQIGEGAADIAAEITGVSCHWTRPTFSRFEPSFRGAAQRRARNP